MRSEKGMKRKTQRFNMLSSTIFGIVFWIMLLISTAYWLSGCAYKHVETRSTDLNGNPVQLSADVIYFCTDQKTSGFKATAPGLDIKFGRQESSARTEILLEVLKAYNAGM